MYRFVNVVNKYFALCAIYLGSSHGLVLIHSVFDWAGKPHSIFVRCCIFVQIN